MKASKRLAGGAIAVFAIATSMLVVDAAGAEPVTFTVDLTWGTATPACGTATTVCEGTGTKTFLSGTPSGAEDQATSLVLSQLPSILQPDTMPVPIGTLKYCNGVTVGDTDIESVSLEAEFSVPPAGSGHATDVATLMVTSNSEDPVASADSLYLASDATKLFTVFENSCAEVQLLGRVTVEPDLIVSLGPVIPPTGSTTTTSTTIAQGTTTTTVAQGTSTTSTTVAGTTSTTSATTTTTVGGTSTTTTTALGPECLEAYYYKCAPDDRADWNCPGSATNALPADWINVRVDGSLPDAMQDPWGLDGVEGPTSSGIVNVGCEPTTTTTTTASRVLGTTARNSTGTTQSGSNATGLAATGRGKSGALALLALGFVLAGMSFVTSDAGRRWHATGAPGVRYTIDSVSRRRR